MRMYRGFLVLFMTLTGLSSSGALSCNGIGLTPTQCGPLSSLDNSACAQEMKGEVSHVENTVRKVKSMTDNRGDIRISVIYDNRAYAEEFEPAWGFSCLVSGIDKTILFDTGGDGSILLGNMESLRIDPKEIDVIVLSHNHWDHTGGLESYLEQHDDVTLFVPSSFPPHFRKGIERFGTEIVDVTGPARICDGVYSTGELGDRIEEQSLIVRTGEGLVVITGCAHPGIVKIVKKAKEVVDDEVLLVIGGFHLGGASKRHLEEIISSFKDLNVRYIAPCHCTGEDAIETFRDEYEEHFIDVGAGKILSINKLR